MQAMNINFSFRLLQVDVADFAGAELGERGLVSRNGGRVQDAELG